MSFRTPSRWLVRLGFAVGAPLACFLLLEATLRLVGSGHTTSFFTPDAERPGMYRTNPQFTSLFLPPSFGIRPLNLRLSREKPANTLRVFVLGESAAQGTPEPALGAAAQLQIRLEGAARGKRVEVVNLAVTAINSHVVRQIARELPDFNPDLLVVYMGNNEVIGPYGPGSGYLEAVPPLWVIRLATLARATRTGQWLLGLSESLARGRDGKAPEWKGMATFSGHLVAGDDPRLPRVYQHFESNLASIVEEAEGAGIPVVLSTVVANLKDHSPFASLHRQAFTTADAAAFNPLREQGLAAWEQGELPKARALLEKALALDPQYSEIQYILGRISLEEGHTDEAREHFSAALHWDALRFRPDPEINRIVRETAKRFKDTVTFIDAALDFGADPASRGALAGDELLFEHVHFNWEGNLRLSKLWAEAAAKACPKVLDSQRLGDDAEVTAELAYDARAEEDMVHSVIELTAMPPFSGQTLCGERQVRLKVRSWQLRGRTSGKASVEESAERLTNALVKHPKDSGLLLRLAACREELHESKEALALVERAGAELPVSAMLLTRRAALLGAVGRQEEAREALREAVALDPYFIPGWHALVDSWCAARLYSDAKKSLEIPLRLMPGNHLLRTAEARLLLRSGEPGAAEQELRSLLREDPSNSAALKQLSTLVSQRGAASEAEALEEDYAKYQPANDANNLRVFRHLLARGKDREALEPLLALARNAPPDPALFSDLAHRLQREGRLTEARIFARRTWLLAQEAGNSDLESEARHLLETLPALP